jgi:hypothetical protein
MDDEAKERLRQWRVALFICAVGFSFVSLLYLSVDPAAFQYRRLQFLFYLSVASFLVALVGFLRALWRVQFARK